MEVESQKHRLLLDMGLVASEITRLSDAIREIRYYWCNKGETLDAMQPAFEFIAQTLEKDLVLKAGEFSKFYNEYNIIGKRK